MALLGKAAMILAFDIVPEAIVEHDKWHSQEHLNERMSIPGFLRGSRWTNLGSGQRYFVMYEVADLDTLASKAYLERLNNPGPLHSNSIAAGDMPLKLPHQNNRSQSSAYAYVL